MDFLGLLLFAKTEGEHTFTITEGSGSGRVMTLSGASRTYSHTAESRFVLKADTIKGFTPEEVDAAIKKAEDTTATAEEINAAANYVGELTATAAEVNAAADYVDDLTVTADKVNTAASTIDQAYRGGIDYISCVPSAQVYSQINGINFASETYSEYDFGNIHTTLIPKEGSATSPDYLTKTIPLTIQLSTAITQTLLSTGTATASLFDVDDIDGLILLVDRELKLEIGYNVMPLHYVGMTPAGFVFQGGIYLSNLGATVPDGYYYFEIIFSNHTPSSNTSVTFNVHYFTPDTPI